MDNDLRAKYLVLDFGNVIAGSPTLHWFITPDFYQFVNRDKLNIEKFNQAIKNNSKLISEKMLTEDEQYEEFKKIYYNIFNEINYDGDINYISEKIAYDFTYNDNLFFLFEDAKRNLERLSKEYKLILLSDNWPCLLRILKHWDIDKFFTKIYISSIYDCKKEQKVFFDFPINDFNIKNGEAIFIDDHEKLVEIAEEKGFIPILMDRFNEYETSKYKIIKSLDNI